MVDEWRRIKQCSRRRFETKDFPGGFLSVALGANDRAARYRTPYKYGKLVLERSTEAGAFDSRTVDCPFVFHHEGRFYMTYVAWDGAGYQTGLASSDNLVDWKKEGCILRRDPVSPVTRYNVAMNWIVRQNELGSPGELKRVDGRFLGVYHAYPKPGLEEGPAVIGLARSDDLMRWEVESPCLRPRAADLGKRRPL